MSGQPMGSWVDPSHPVRKKIKKSHLGVYCLLEIEFKIEKYLIYFYSFLKIFFYSMRKDQMFVNIYFYFFYGSNRSGLVDLTQMINPFKHACQVQVKAINPLNYSGRLTKNSPD